MCASKHPEIIHVQEFGIFLDNLVSWPVQDEMHNEICIEAQSSSRLNGVNSWIGTCDPLLSYLGPSVRINEALRKRPLNSASIHSQLTSSVFTTDSFIQVREKQGKVTSPGETSFTVGEITHRKCVKVTFAP